MKLFIKALKFASEKHQNQQRKQGGGIPFINHPIEVAHILAQAGVQDEFVLAGALLHDTLDDTDATLEQLQQQFGSEITKLVQQCSDAPGLTECQGKKNQIEKALKVSKGAKLIKMADKISNNRYVLKNPPQKWSPEKRKGYFVWSQTVTNNLKGVNFLLDKQINQIFDQSGINSLQEKQRAGILQSFFSELQK